MVDAPGSVRDGFEASLPRALFQAPNGIHISNYDVSPDGERFVMVRDSETSQPRINVVLILVRRARAARADG